MFYMQEMGDTVTQVYEVGATNFEEAKRVAMKEMQLQEGDILAECGEDAIDSTYDGVYHSIIEEDCTNYAVLARGVWTNTTDDKEVFCNDIFYFSDSPEDYLDKNGDPYNFDLILEEV